MEFMGKEEKHYKFSFNSPEVRPNSVTFFSISSAAAMHVWFKRELGSLTRCCVNTDWILYESTTVLWLSPWLQGRVDKGPGIITKCQFQPGPMFRKPCLVSVEFITISRLGRLQKRICSTWILNMLVITSCYLICML